MKRILRHLQIWQCPCRATTMRIMIDVAFEEYESPQSINASAYPPSLSCPKCYGSISLELVEAQDG